MKFFGPLAVLMISLIFVLACNPTKSDPPNVLAWPLADGLSKFQKGDLEGAIIEYTKVIDSGFMLECGYFGRGISRSLLNRNLGALYDFTKAINENSKCGYYYTNRAETLIKLGFTKLGCRDLTIAKKLGDVDADKLIEKYCRDK